MKRIIVALVASLFAVSAFAAAPKAKHHGHKHHHAVKKAAATKAGK